MIENDLKRLKQYYRTLERGQYLYQKEKLESLRFWNGEIPLRYCHERDVLAKRESFLKFKAIFLEKMKLM